MLGLPNMTNKSDKSVTSLIQVKQKKWECDVNPAQSVQAHREEPMEVENQLNFFVLYHQAIITAALSCMQHYNVVVG